MDGCINPIKRIKIKLNVEKSQKSNKIITAIRKSLSKVTSAGITENSKRQVIALGELIEQAAYGRIGSLWRYRRGLSPIKPA